MGKQIQRLVRFGKVYYLFPPNGVGKGKRSCWQLYEENRNRKMDFVKQFRNRENAVAYIDKPRKREGALTRAASPVGFEPDRKSEAEADSVYRIKALTKTSVKCKMQIKPKPVDPRHDVQLPEGVTVE